MKRHWFQFRLSTLVAVVIVCGGLMLLKRSIDGDPNAPLEMFANPANTSKPAEISRWSKLYDHFDKATSAELAEIENERQAEWEAIHFEVRWRKTPVLGMLMPREWLIFIGAIGATIFVAEFFARRSERTQS